MPSFLLALSFHGGIAGSQFRVLTMVGLALVFFAFSYHYACFRTKYQGYPFRLFF